MGQCKNGSSIGAMPFAMQLYGSTSMDSCRRGHSLIQMCLSRGSELNYHVLRLVGLKGKALWEGKLFMNQTSLS
ncbi:MAG: hypothetical protein LZF62_480228 [Nitrospira sp.]|nr:MAG: hypothetical protein LZF62_480228 [Nitrospira sp.]